jgi:hypothetical protein
LRGNTVTLSIRKEYSIVFRWAKRPDRRFPLPPQGRLYAALDVALSASSHRYAADSNTSRRIRPGPKRREPSGKIVFDDRPNGRVVPWKWNVAETSGPTIMLPKTGRSRSSNILGFTSELALKRYSRPRNSGSEYRSIHNESGTVLRGMLSPIKSHP